MEDKKKFGIETFLNTVTLAIENPENENTC